jgi:hypothetical protein
MSQIDDSELIPCSSDSAWPFDIALPVRHVTSLFLSWSSALTTLLPFSLISPPEGALEDAQEVLLRADVVITSPSPAPCPFAFLLSRLFHSDDCFLTRLSICLSASVPPPLADTDRSCSTDVQRPRTVGIYRNHGPTRRASPPRPAPSSVVPLCRPDPSSHS